MGNQFVKHPDALLEYCVDWSRWLGTDTIQDSEWSDPAGIETDNPSHTDTASLIWIGGGTAETTYRVENKITTAEGRTNVRHLEIAVRDYNL